MTSSIVGLLRLASVVICLIVAAWFVTFAVDETHSASNHQVQVTEGVADVGEQPVAKAPAHESSMHRTLDDTAEALTSPFSGLTSAESEWATRGFKLLAALLVYGFGLGYLARMLRVRL